ncbi:MAG: hypothetical protein GY755_22220 [Chloroflexi bacterium]|nr:hypothetical protein [Chloroflexota bacterium]
MNREVIWPTIGCDGVEILIHREIECGSDWDFDDDGNMVATEPEWFEYYTLLDGSLRCESIEEIQQEIDNLIRQTIDRNIPVDIMLETLDSEG